MRVLGIDPGSQVTGYGVVEQSKDGLVHVAHGNLRPPKSASPAVRLQTLYRSLCEVIEHHQPEQAAVEEVFVSASPRSALILGQARGVALAAIGASGLPTNEYAATRIKQAVTGSGRSSKQQVQSVIRRMLCLDRVQADAADALAAAVCCLNAGRLERMGVVARGRRRPSRHGVHIRVGPRR